MDNIEAIKFDVIIWSGVNNSQMFIYRIEWSPDTRYNGVIDEAIKLFTLDTNDCLEMSTNRIELRELPQ